MLALLTNQGVDNAARAVGIAPRTLYRWMNEPLFDKAYRKARRAAFGQGTARLQQASGAAVSTVLKIMVDQNAAVSTVLKIMVDQNAAASTKLRAAELVLTHGAKAIEIEDVEARVSELERAAEEAKQKR